MTDREPPKLAESDEGKVFLGLLLQTTYSNSAMRLRRSLMIFAAIFMVGAIFDVLPSKIPSLGVTVPRSDALQMLTVIVAFLLLEFLFTASNEFYALQKLPSLGLTSLQDFFDAEKYMRTMEKYTNRNQVNEDERAELYAATVAFWKPGSNFDQYFRAMAIAAGDAKTIRRAKNSYLFKVYYQYISTVLVGMLCLVVCLLLR